GVDHEGPVEHGSLPLSLLPSRQGRAAGTAGGPTRQPLPPHQTLVQMRMATIMAKRAKASMNASATRSVERMSPAASGSRPMMSIPRTGAHPWLEAETIAGIATASATLRNSTGLPPFQLAARAATVLGPHSMPLHHLSEVAHREDAE